MPATPVVTVRADPALIGRARLGLGLPASASVSEVVRAALELAGGAESPDGVVPRGGWRGGRRFRVDKSTMRVVERR